MPGASEGKNIHTKGDRQMSEDLENLPISPKLWEAVICLSFAETAKSNMIAKG